MIKTLGKKKLPRFAGNVQLPKHGSCKVFTHGPGKMFAVKPNGEVLLSTSGGHTWKGTGCTERLLIRALATKKLTRTKYGVVYRLEGKGTFIVKPDGTVLKKVGERKWKPATEQNKILFRAIHKLKS